MPYKLNSEEYSLTVVQLKIQKEKRPDCFLDVNRVKHKNDHQKPRALTSLGPQSLWGTARDRVLAAALHPKSGYQ